MSMTVEQRPSSNDLHGAFEPLYFVLSSTEQQSASNYKFRYIADLYVDAVKVSSVKIYPNNEGEGVFRVERLIQDWMSTTRADQNVTTSGYYDKSIHAVGINDTTKPFSTNNGETYRKVQFKFGQEYSTAADQDPTQYLDQVNATIHVIMTAGFQRSTTWDNGIADLWTSENWLDNFAGKSNKSHFLSDRTHTTDKNSTTVTNRRYIEQQTTQNSRNTLGFLIDPNQPIDSDIASVYVACYDSSDSSLGAGHLIPGTHGGSAPADVNTDRERLQFLGVGPLNLTACPVTPIASAMSNANLAYYEVIGMKDTTTVPDSTNTADQATKVYRFDVIDAGCSMYNSSATVPDITIVWQNTLGAYDYQLFSLRYDYSVNVKRKEFEQVSGNWDSASTTVDFNYRGDEGGIRIAGVEAHQELTATTDLLNESDVDLLETLMLSPNVYISINGAEGNYAPIVVKDTSFIKKRGVNERGQYLYQIKFKYAKKRPTTKGGTNRSY